MWKALSDYVEMETENHASNKIIPLTCPSNILYVYIYVTTLCMKDVYVQYGAFSARVRKKQLVTKIEEQKQTNQIETFGGMLRLPEMFEILLFLRSLQYKDIKSFCKTVLDNI